MCVCVCVFVYLLFTQSLLPTHNLLKDKFIQMFFFLCFNTSLSTSAVLENWVNLSFKLNLPPHQYHSQVLLNKVLKILDYTGYLVMMSPTFPSSNSNRHVLLGRLQGRNLHLPFPHGTAANVTSIWALCRRGSKKVSVTARWMACWGYRGRLGTLVACVTHWKQMTSAGHLSCATDPYFQASAFSKATRFSLI